MICIEPGVDDEQKYMELVDAFFAAKACLWFGSQK